MFPFTANFRYGPSRGGGGGDLVRASVTASSIDDKSLLTVLTNQVELSNALTRRTIQSRV